jgi:predicted dehydrogenase
VKKIRLGIIGCGNIGSQHYSNVLNGRCPEIDVMAIADVNPDRLDWAKSLCQKYRDQNLDIPEVQLFSDASEMLASGLIEAVIISVPHYDHPRYAIEAFKCGVHVMCEKPAGVYTLQVRDMIAEADRHPELNSA